MKAPLLSLEMELALLEECSALGLVGRAAAALGEALDRIARRDGWRKRLNADPETRDWLANERLAWLDCKPAELERSR